MEDKEQGLSWIQIIIMISSMMIGVTILTVPREVTIATDSPDGWLSSVLGLVLGLIAGGLAALLSMMFPRLNFFQFSQKILGKLLGSIISIGYIVFLVMFSAHELRVLGEVIRFYLLYQTPIEVLILIMVLAVIYLLWGDLNSLARVQQMFFPIIIMVLIFVLMTSLSVIKVEHIQPVLGEGIMPVIRGLPQQAFAFLGFSIIMVLTTYMQRPEQALRSVLIGISVSGVLNIMVIAASIMAFSYEALQGIIFPVIELAKELEIPGGFFERIESVFLTIFIMTIFSTITIGLFIASLGCSQLFKVKRKGTVLGVVPITVLLSLWPHDLDAVFVFGQQVTRVGVFYVGAVPAVLFLVAKLRNLDERTSKEGKACR